jgi:hypothetical protein
VGRLLEPLSSWPAWQHSKTSSQKIILKWSLWTTQYPYPWKIIFNPCLTIHDLWFAFSLYPPRPPFSKCKCAPDRLRSYNHVPSSTCFPQIPFPHGETVKFTHSSRRNEEWEGKGLLTKRLEKGKQKPDFEILCPWEVKSLLFAYSSK